MLEIVFQHTDFYVFNKPTGLSFHSEQCAGFVVIAERQVNEKLFSVHRLDKVTSGLIILARHSEAAAQLTELFASHLINKFYLALSDKKPKKKQGWVKGDMAKSRRSAYKLLKTHNNPAITRFYSLACSNGLRGFLLKPYSGKTHQLRVALKSLSAPILGDSLYGGTLSDRTYLHAYALEFTWQNQCIQLVCKPDVGDQYTALDWQQTLFPWVEPWLLDW
ncbi:tRNA pseudouridine32 synthase / 23S rRNA pseudouridine746 synthase [Pseudoalteromonas ulvae UL12]|uniref:RNA pseudouridine synthase n=1 Tax=Pseudoalteromonas ulvae TaxID=107327 RepID=A0A244CM77_PSEDV|nr:TIGR01621 family pseudouridine synthase [Pseudoalteromonas ulvae]MBE0363910.1 tRNA pseudouridine32 synthase / 23S rRNA pseudouridine746 synthase [Pseudoalteromonas ulvae UL12]OUL56704.1 RNA pseudouridine synthase [Pseudoalteromonas ulvae]